MKNTVRYFAVFREQAGVASELVEWPGGSAQELFALMASKHASLKSESAALVAVNDEMSDWEKPLLEGDVVLFFPPVAGG
jgi:molybdopterin converting factor small subunit